jgi:hypothetical protein
MGHPGHDECAPILHFSIPVAGHRWARCRCISSFSASMFMPFRYTQSTLSSMSPQPSNREWLPSDLSVSWGSTQRKRVADEPKSANWQARRSSDIFPLYAFHQTLDTSDCPASASTMTAAKEKVFFDLSEHVGLDRLFCNDPTSIFEPSIGRQYYCVPT